MNTMEEVKSKLIEKLIEKGLVILPEPLASNHFMDNEVLSYIIDLNSIADRLLESNIKYINILSLEDLNDNNYILRCKLYPAD